MKRYFNTLKTTIDYTVFAPVTPAAFVHWQRILTNSTKQNPS